MDTRVYQGKDYEVENWLRNLCKAFPNMEIISSSVTTEGNIITIVILFKPNS